MTDCLIVSARADEYTAALAAYEDLALSMTACTSLEQATQRYSGQRIVFDPGPGRAPARCYASGRLGAIDVGGCFAVLLRPVDATTF